MVVFRSTMLPGSVEDRLVPRLEAASGGKLGKDFGVCYNPEFLREGTAVADFFGPPITVLGVADERSAAPMKALYAPKRFPSPRDILATPPEQLRAAGLSAAKTAALRDLAERSLDGTVPTMRRVRLMGDEEVITRLVQVRGVGRWTAEMLLMFRLGRGDVLPVSDLGIRKGFALTFGSRRLPAAITIERRAERWRPYRSVACWYLWRALEQ